jgi:hypothetical protein
MLKLNDKDLGRISFFAILVLLSYINYLIYGNLISAGIQAIILFFIGIKMKVW